jgi:2-polyprenyl-6-methoxyphenol hydroxylase-like FAD-dependent oxidoreductase
MRIIIIGGGIGGFSAYHALRKELSEVHPSATIVIYEAYPSASETKNIVGGGLGLAPNGLRALSSLSLGIEEDLQTQAFLRERMALRNSTGKLLGHMCVKGKERYGFSELMLPRATVHDAVLRGVPREAVQWEKRVREVRETDEGVEVEFEDGTTDSGDLVIGADGVRSKVREAIFGRKYDAEYE